MAVSARQHRLKSLAESIASLEEQLSEAERVGNTRKARVIKLILARLKRDKKLGKIQQLTKERS